MSAVTDLANLLYSNDRAHDLTLELIRESDSAYLVSDGVKQVWLPKSYSGNNGDGTFTAPYWIAKKKGLS